MAFSKSSAVTTPHFFFGIETTTPVPKNALSGISSRKGVPSIDVCRRVDVCAGMHYRGDLLGEHTASGHVVQSLDLDVLEVRPCRHTMTPRVRQVVELQLRLGFAEGPGETHDP